MRGEHTQPDARRHASVRRKPAPARAIFTISSSSPISASTTAVARREFERDVQLFTVDA